MDERSERHAGTPLDTSREIRPPILRRGEIVAFSLVSLLVVTIVAVLYVGRPFFLPLVSAFIIATMLSPAAKVLEAYRIPRSVSAVLIVGATFASFVFIIGLISVPLVEWSTRLPELGPELRDKLRVFDRPLALWHQFLASLGGAPAWETSSFSMPTIEWVQPTVEFLSPTFTELLLFFVLLILFIASWPELRRTLVMLFPDREARLRTLRMLNEIEGSLGGYLMTVTVINAGLGIVTGLICLATNMPNPAGLGALAATLNFIPIIGPVVMFMVLALVGIVTAPTFAAGLLAAMLFAAAAFVEGHFITPVVIGRRLALNALAVFIALAFWAWLWGPMGAFLSSPLLIIGLVMKEHLLPDDTPQMPGD